MQHDLTELFRTNDLKYAYDKLSEFGGIYGIERILKDKRIQDIRNNSVQYNFQGIQRPSLLKVILLTLANVYQITLNVIIILLLILSFYQPNDEMRYQSYYILGFNIFAVTISVINNWRQTKTAQEISIENNWIVRTKNEHGNEIQKFQQQLKEGDILLLEPNKKVINVDGNLFFSILFFQKLLGLLIQGDIQVDESLLTGEYELQRKTIYNVNETQNSPFFYSGSKVYQGYGELLVVVVGNNTQYVKIKRKSQGNQNPMFAKLFNAYQLMYKMGIIVAIIFLIYQIVLEIVKFSYNNKLIFSHTAIEEYLTILLVASTIFIQSVPQSYAFFGSYSFVYIVNCFLKDLLLIRSLRSVEIFAYINHIITDIKGVFTLDKLKITEIWYQEQNVLLFSRFSLLPDEIRQHFINCCLFNTSYDPHEEIVRGYDFEIALVNHCSVLGQHRSDYKPEERIIKQFKQYKQKKYKMTIVKINEEFVLYVTGDYDKVIPKCIQSKRFLKFDKLNSKYIALAYKVLNIPNINYVHEKDLFKNLNLIFTIGFQDQKIVTLDNVIDELKFSNLRLTMITEDPVYYARNFVENLSIDVDLKYSVISGKEFRDLSGGVIRDGADFKVKNFENFVQIANNIKVLAEATPLDKFILTVGLQQMGDIICAIGRKDQGFLYFNLIFFYIDIPTVRQSNLGICLESKSDETIRLESDIIAFSGQFNAIFNGFRWSKSLLIRMRKLIQQQIPIILTIIYTNIVTFILYGYENSINPFKTFWLVIILSILQGIQFASEPAHYAIKQSTNPHINDPIINAYVLKVIFFQLFYQMIIINLLIFLSSQDIQDVSLDQRTSMIFTTLILLSIFGSIVSKMLDNLNTSAFSVLFDSNIFIVMLITQLLSSYFMLFFAGHLFQIVELDQDQHIKCLGISFGIIIIIPIASLMPTKWFRFIHRQIKKDVQYRQTGQFELSESLRFQQ